MGQIGKKLPRTRQELDVGRHPIESRGMEASQHIDAFRIDMISGFAQEHSAEQAAAHADLAMDAPDRQLDPFRRQRLAPGQHVLIDTVDQCAVEVEQE
jgi:hypothetical protein